MYFNEYHNRVKDLIDELELHGTNPYHIIYQIGDLKVYGQFDEFGTRGIDHNILKFNDITWEDILYYGTVVVPETQTYISDEEISDFEKLGYLRLPTNDNHIIRKGAYL